MVIWANDHSKALRNLLMAVQRARNKKQPPGWVAELELPPWRSATDPAPPHEGPDAATDPAPPHEGPVHRVPQSEFKVGFEEDTMTAWRAVIKKNGKLGPKEFTDNVILPSDGPFYKGDEHTECIAKFADGTYKFLGNTVYEMKRKIEIKKEQSAATTEVWKMESADGKKSVAVKLLPQKGRPWLAVLDDMLTKK